MPISQNMCVSYKKEIIEGLHSSTHDYKVALFTDSATLNKTTTSYIGLSDEVSNSGTNYTTGGTLLTGFAVSLINDTAILDFNDAIWLNASFTARGCLIYNDSLAGKNSVCVLDFGSDYTATNGEFRLTFPAPGEATAIVRVV